jgi:hypothetical protein
MMTKKKAAKKKAVAKNGGNGAGNEAWTVDEKKVFDEFGIGLGDESMRKLIRGQRSINHRFYESIEVILARLPKLVSNKKTGKDEELERVIELNKGVPGDSPGCG